MVLDFFFLLKEEKSEEQSESEKMEGQEYKKVSERND